MLNEQQMDYMQSLIKTKSIKKITEYNIGNQKCSLLLLNFKENAAQDELNYYIKRNTILVISTYFLIRVNRFMLACVI